MIIIKNTKKDPEQKHVKNTKIFLKNKTAKDKKRREKDAKILLKKKKKQYIIIIKNVKKAT